MKGRAIKKRMTVFIIILFLIIGFAPVEQGVSVFGTTSTGELDKPLFSSSFIQHWYCEDFDQARWKKELTMLQQLGINELILQAVAFTDSKYVAYPTKLEGYTGNNVDMLKNALTAADSLKMNVRIGLGFNHKWWEKRANDIEWLKGEADANKALVSEIIDMYGTHPSLSGWYIPHEFSQVTAITLKQQANLNYFYKEISSEIKLKSPGKDIMISPFYNSKYSWSPLMPVWTLMVRNIMKDTGIDILALQDAVGAKYNSTEQLSEIFAYTKKATDAAGVKLYAVTETFTAGETRYVPSTQASISAQISAVKACVKNYVAFSISHYQNSNEASQSDNFSDYLKYYTTNE
jgi:hypothetical protein